MKTLLIVLALLGGANLRAQEPTSSKLLITSDAALLGATIGDILSSRGRYEENPFLGTGPFGAKQAGISLGITAAMVLAEIPMVKKWPRLKKPLSILNFGASAEHGYAIIHNMQ